MPISPSGTSEVDDRAEVCGVGRALLWVLGGLALAALVLVGFAPELLRLGGGAVAELLGLVLVAGVPGLVLLVIVAVRRRRLGLDDDPDPTTADRER